MILSSHEVCFIGPSFGGLDATITTCAKESFGGPCKCYPSAHGDLFPKLAVSPRNVEFGSKSSGDTAFFVPDSSPLSLSFCF